MAQLVQPGYLGIAKISSTGGIVTTRCTAFTLTPQQDVQFYNHVLGMNDVTGGGGVDTKSESIGTIHMQRTFWRPSVVKISGGLSFLGTSGAGGNNYAALFDAAKTGKYIDSIDFQYYCDVTKSFTDCRINTMDFNITAGDVLNVSIDVLAKSMSGPTSGTISYTTPEKLITWDKVSVEVSGGYFLTKIQGFSLSINNNAAYIYTGKPNGSGSATDKESLFPYDIRLGTQEVSGSVMVYLDQGEEFIPIVLANPYTIKFILPGLTITMPVVFNSQNLAGVVGPVITTIPFVGVDKALGA